MCASAFDDTRVVAEPAPPAIRYSRRRVCLWLALILGLAQFVLLYHIAESQRRDNFAEEQLLRSINWDLWLFAGDSPAEVNSSLKNGQTLSPLHRTSGNRYDATLPGLGVAEAYRDWKVRVEFAADPSDNLRLQTWHPIPPHVISRGPSSFWMATECTRIALIVLTPIPWCACVVIAICVRGMGRKVWPICFAAAAICTTAASIASNYQLVWRGSKLGWIYVGAGMILVSPLVRWVRPGRRLSPPGLCENCRYDLTGNESGICPECGTATPSHRRRQHLAEFEEAASRLGGVTERDIGASDLVETYPMSEVFGAVGQSCSGSDCPAQLHLIG